MNQARKAAQSFLSHVAKVLEESLPMIRRNLVMQVNDAEGGMQLYCLSHPTSMNEKQYVVVTARAVSPAEARTFMSGQSQPRWGDDNVLVIERKKSSPGSFGPWGPEGRQGN